MTEEDFWKANYQINCNTSWWNAPCNKEKESATIAKFHDLDDDSEEKKDGREDEGEERG